MASSVLAPTLVEACVGPGLRATNASGEGAAAPARDGCDEAATVRARLQVAIEALTGLAEVGAGAADWSTELRTVVLAGWDRISGQVVAGQAAVLDAHLRSGAWTGSGDRDEAAWRARTGREGLAAGLAHVRTARTLARLPVVATALADGGITPAHVDQLARVTTATAPQVVAQLASPDGQDEVLRLSARTDGRTFGKALACWAAERDPVAVQNGHDAQRAARFLHLSETRDGTAVRALLDPQAGRRLRLALESVTPAPAADDERTSEQRRADALGALAERALSATDSDVPGGLGRTQVSVVLTERTWLAVRRTEGSAGAIAQATVGVPPATDEDGSPVPASELGRLLCDCDLTRIVLGADSSVTDLGRTARLHTPRLRKAIAARDGGCVWAGCTMPARYCQVHRPRWWSRGGGTSVSNGVLLCSFHHHEVHPRDLGVARHPGRPGRPGPFGTPVASYVVTDPGGRVLADSRAPAVGPGRRAGSALASGASPDPPGSPTDPAGSPPDLADSPPDLADSPPTPPGSPPDHLLGAPISAAPGVVSRARA